MRRSAKRAQQSSVLLQELLGQKEGSGVPKVSRPPSLLEDIRLQPPSGPKNLAVIDPSLEEGNACENAS